MPASDGFNTLSTAAIAAAVKGFPPNFPGRKAPGSYGSDHDDCSEVAPATNKMQERVVSHLRPVGAGNSVVVVDLPRWGPMLSPRVPNLVPIPSPRMERETPGQRPRPNYGHPHAVGSSVTRMMWSSTATPSNRPNNSGPASLSGSGPGALSCIPMRRRSCTAKTRSAVMRRSTPASTFSATPSGVAWPVADEASS